MLQPSLYSGRLTQSRLKNMRWLLAAHFPLFSCQVIGRELHFFHILWHERNQSGHGQSPQRPKI